MVDVPSALCKTPGGREVPAGRVESLPRDAAIKLGPGRESVGRGLPSSKEGTRKNGYKSRTLLWTVKRSMRAKT
jgi:hypothetical protein